MRRWSLPASALSAAAQLQTSTDNDSDDVPNNNNNNNNGDGNDGDIETPTRRAIEPPTRRAPRRNTVSATTVPYTAEDAAAAQAARAAAFAEEQYRLSIIYAQLNEAFGVDFGAAFGAMLADAETPTIATTRSDPSCYSQDDGEEDVEGGGADDENNNGGDGNSNTNPTNNGGNTPRSSVRRSENSHIMYALDPDTGLQLPVATPVGVEREMREEFHIDWWSLCMCLFLTMFMVLIVSAAIFFLVLIILGGKDIGKKL
mmetsp:Transcript_14189/g.26962  ORF Transcript_14189/g.26962 Transcript_14189/m.26962 type:complete len:258 (+) Transcript_14189:97-870(+)